MYKTSNSPPYIQHDYYVSGRNESQQIMRQVYKNVSTSNMITNIFYNSEVH